MSPLPVIATLMVVAAVVHGGVTSQDHLDICNNTVSGINCEGGDLIPINKAQLVHSAAECCDICKKTPNCTTWTWNSETNGRCYPKDSCPNPTSLAGEITGSTSLIPPVPPPPPPPTPCLDCPWLDPTIPVTKRVSDLMAALTLDEKISLMGTDSPAIPHLGLPQYGWWSEAAHGVAWAGRATVFPAPIGMAASFNVDAMSAVGEAIGYEGRAKHNNYINKTGHGSTQLFGISFFAPNINIVRDIRWGRAQETFGEDPTLTKNLGVALIKAMQSNASYGDKYPLVSATAKHFFAYNLESNYAAGGTNGQYRLKANVNVSDTDLVQTYFPAFDAAVEQANVRSIMCSYNSVNGIPACGHPMIQSQLRDKDSFGGFVVSDCGAIGWMGPTEHNYTKGDPESAALGVNAGTDLNCGSCYTSALKQAVQEGLTTEASIDVALQRTLSARIELGLLDPPGTNEYQLIGMDVVDSDKHRALALQVAIESIVLLKNNDNFLPIKAANNIAVIGPNANRTLTLLSNYPGCKNSPGGPIDPTCTLVNPLDGISKAVNENGGKINYSQGCEIDGNDTSMIEDALTTAKNADYVVMIMGLITCQETGQYCQEAEAHDRVNVTLPAIQEQLLHEVAATGKKIILVLMSGSTVSIPWAAASPNVVSIVQLWYPGEEGGTALAKILFGEENPSGRLPATVFTGLDQLPADYLSSTMSDSPGRTHRYFSGTPLYAFGFGLSYSKFAWTQMQLTPTHIIGSTKFKVTVSATLTCTGGIPGVEVAQLYTSLKASDRFNGNRSIPLRELKKFERISVSECSGSSKSISFDLVPEDLTLVDTDGSLSVIPGAYDIWLGGTGPGPQGLYTKTDEPLHMTLTVS